MKQLLVLTLMLSVSGSPTAFAAESIVQSAVRITREAARAQAVSSENAPAESSRSNAVIDSQASQWVNKVVADSTEAKAAQDAGVLSTSGMGKGKKAAIFMALGVGFVAAAWTIDHRVQDITPSSLGTRQD